MDKTANRGFLISPYSAHSERMAYTLVRSLRRYNADIPILVLAQDYLCGLDWRGLAKVRSVRAAEAHGTAWQWFNKLAAILRTPFEETVYLDCDIVALDNLEDWFGLLGTDDFTWFQFPYEVSSVPDHMNFNMVNPHRMREEYGVTSVPAIDGCGHFFFRNTRRGHQLVQWVIDLMVESMESPDTSLYRRMTGHGNIQASDEAAACIVAVRDGIRLPDFFPAHAKQMGIYLPPHQRDGIFDLGEGFARYTDAYSGEEVIPRAVHFCYNSKHLPAYRAFIEATLNQSLKRPQPVLL